MVVKAAITPDPERSEERLQSAVETVRGLLSEGKSWNEIEGQLAGTLDANEWNQVKERVGKERGKAKA